MKAKEVILYVGEYALRNNSDNNSDKHSPLPTHPYETQNLK